MEELTQEIRKAKITSTALVALLITLLLLSLLKGTDSFGEAPAVDQMSATAAGGIDAPSGEDATTAEEPTGSGTDDPPERDDGLRFDAIEIEAASAILFDVRSGTVLFEENAHERRPLASLTKIMTALVALELVGPDFQVTVTREHLGQYGNSGLYVDELWRLRDLVDVSMMTSANDAAFAIASSVGAAALGTTEEEGRQYFISAMNQMAHDLEMHNTHFTNPTGLDEDISNGGAYGSAYDVAKLVDHVLATDPEILYPTRHRSVSRTSLSGIRHQLINTNIIVSNLDGIMASKTGYTDLAGGNLVVVFDADLNRPVIAVVLGSTFTDRFDDARALLKAARR